MRAPYCGAGYQARISGPLFDRIELHPDVPARAAADLPLPPPAEGSTAIARRIAEARALQIERYADEARARNSRRCAPAPPPLFSSTSLHPTSAAARSSATT